MRRLNRYLVVTTVVAAFGAAGTLVANAGWSTPGEGTLKVSTATMPRGTQPTALDQGDHALISWDAQEISAGVRMRRYVVTAHSVDDKPGRTIVRAVAATGADRESVTFSRAELAGGKWKWAIIPQFAAWAGPEGQLSNPKLVFPANAAATEISPPTSLAAARTVVKPAAPTSDDPERTVGPSPAPTKTEPTTNVSPAVEPTSDSPAPTQSTPAPEPSASDESTAPPIE